MPKKMEGETYDVNKRYNSSSLSFWHSLCAIPVVVVVVAFGYFWLPAIVDYLEECIVWFNWCCWVLSCLSIGLFVVSGLTVLIYVFFWKTTGESKPKLSHQYHAADSGFINNFRYNEINVPAFQAVREGHCSYERVVAEYRRTTSQTMNGLSVEEVRMSSVATHISENNYNGGFPQLQNGDVQRQRSRDDGTGLRRHRSRNKKLVGGSGSTGSGSYLAITN